MSPLWGVHTGLQNTTFTELQELWRRIDQVEAFVDAGADQINLSLRAPWDLTVLDHLAAAKDQFAA